MKMELIQPFVNAMDAVLAETLQSSPKIVDLTMEEEGYRRKGLAALIQIRGEIEGRIILDMEGRTAAQVASILSGSEVEESEDIVRETVCELANMVIGNAVTLLNDRGFRFKVFPPEVHQLEQCEKAGQDSEALILCFETEGGNVYMNIAMRYLKRRSRERATVPAA
ncbi:MAG: chemotaxis protein CheX [Candidatus Acidiferrales bacterium]